MTVDLDEAQRFLDALDPEAESFTFQTVDDAERKRGALLTTLHGTLEQHAERLAALNAEGAGVFVTVQETDGQGRNKTNITRVRAVFADFDPPGTAAMPEAFEIEPHMIVQSSPGKHHVYWLADDVALDSFKPLQKSIIQRYGSDPQPCDLPRVMRLPGFQHRKGEPFMVRMFHESGALPYPANRLRAAFNAAPAALQTAPAVATDSIDADRHGDLLVLTRHLAAQVVFNKMARDSAMAALRAERQRGRWTRDVPDGELARGLAGAIGKFSTGEWKKPLHLQSEDAPKRPCGLVWAWQVDESPLSWVVKDYIVQDSLAALVGASGSGKSFIAIDIACCVATGTPWHGREVSQGPVFYLAGEGQRGLRKRIRGWEQVNEISITNQPLALSAGIPALCDPQHSEATIEEIKQKVKELGENAPAPALIVVDTLARAMAGRNENSTDDMGLFIHGLDQMRLEWKCAVIVVHHTGHAAPDRGRGSSAFYAALDSEFLIRKTDGVSMVGSKEKDWPTPRPIEFTKIVTPIGDETTLVLKDATGQILASTKNKREQVLELKAQGLSQREIVKQTGVPKTTVGRYIKEAE